MGRYERQVNLKGFGEAAQNMLVSSKVLIVGLGGLGVPVAQYLNAMGVGTLGLVDGDHIDLNNLQRQVLYSESEVGMPKVKIAKTKLQAQNSETQFFVFDTFLTSENALDIIKPFDVVVDASDNFATRYLINDACILLDKPFVYGALHAFEGQVSVFNHQNGPSYRCLFPTMPQIDEVPNCDENGVLGVLPSIVGSLQALEVVKLLTGMGTILSGSLLLYDGLLQRTQQVKFKKNPENWQITKLLKDYGFSGCGLMSTISAEAFIKIKDKVQLIDVRNPKEFAAGHLPNAVSLPLGDVVGQLDKIDLERAVYLVCQSGKRSKMAAQQLIKQHPQLKAISIDGGMNQIMQL